ncbi:Transmembrane protein 218 [Collichthys lucidus]|uniref:Transmembrane protein 218 n=1 Tax=Collichthys lucidus TaxID=240159 RepID=A0A4U5V7N5_COLLU|nr:Transmembrane protein 218 [Collichthys lucidus]
MASTVLQVGTGVFVIAMVWIAALVFGTMLLRASGSARRPSQIVDSLFIGRYVLLAAVSAVFLVVFFILLPFHFLEPVYAKALRMH